jgi:hypothetical protein
MDQELVLTLAPVNPYQSPLSAPAPDASDANRQKTIALIPFLVAVPLIGATIWLLVFSGIERRELALPIGVCIPLLLFDLIICAWVVVEWLRWGEPPEFSLVGLIPSRAAREFHHQLRLRPKLTPDEFHAAFYADSGIPLEFTAKLREALERSFGMDFSTLHPDDNLLLVDDGEMNFAWEFECIEREFKVTFPRTRVTHADDATFRFLLNCVVDATQQAKSS